jgi:hypothetical protein
MEVAQPQFITRLILQYVETAETALLTPIISKDGLTAFPRPTR